MHRWDLTPKEAIELQKTLREQVKLVPLRKKPALIGGCDVSMSMFAKEGYAGFVVLDKALQVVDHSVVKDKIPFPYILGFYHSARYPCSPRLGKS
jgi:deoxyribonuclease V